MGENTNTEPAETRELTAVEMALENAAQDKSLIQDFYDLFLESEVVVGTRGKNLPGDGPEDDLIVLIDHKDIPHLPVFASDAAMDMWDGADKVGRVSIPVLDLLAGVEPKMRMVLNPGLGVAKAFDAKEIRMLRRMARRKDRADARAETRVVNVSFAPVTHITEEAYTRMAAAVSARRTLKALYIVNVDDTDRPSGSYMLVLIDVRPSDFEAAGEKLVDILAELFEEGTPVEIACLQDEPMWADLIQDNKVRPVYPRAL